MKKKKWRVILIVVILLAILFVPIPTGIYKDGGTRVYTAVTYKIVDWNRLMEDGSIYEKTRVYFGGDCLKSISELWELELQKTEPTFLATVIELNDTTAIVEPMEFEKERNSSDRISFNIEHLNEIEVEVGSIVKIAYTGEIKESYPASIQVKSWEMAMDLRPLEYTGKWLDKDTADDYSSEEIRGLIITKIYANCFFAEPQIYSETEIKLNGTIGDEWCVGDVVHVTCKNGYFDSVNHRIEADLVRVSNNYSGSDSGVRYKPVIYLYPEKETKVSVKLALDGELTCTYPAYNNGWNVTASPDGTLTDKNGQTYNYLYWEDENHTQYDFTKGFCVKGEDTATFLEDALERLGLTRREANEFIVYWLPHMEQNPYNIISFQTDAYTDAAKLTVKPEPDTLIRVFMAWQESDSYVNIKEQTLTAPERAGFTVVEWGGTEVK